VIKCRLFVVLVVGLVLLSACSATPMAQPALTAQPTATTQPTATATPIPTERPTPRPPGLAKYEPPDGTVLVFVGQDNESVGGNDRFDDGYADNVGIPAGITHYVGFSILKDHVMGLNAEETWGAGPMCLKYYLDSPTFDASIVHLSVSMVSAEAKVADGSLDHQIDELVQFLQEHDDTPFLLRIGYEFDGHWNHYEPEPFKQAWHRIVDRLRAGGVDNFATVMSGTTCNTTTGTWKAFWPGDEYVDWCGYSYWAGDPYGCGSIEFAQEHGKPIFIAESTPRGRFLDKLDGERVWTGWYETYFKHIEENVDVVKAISYINCNWDAQPMWSGWGNSRIEVNDYVKEKWLAKMAEPMYLNAEDDVYPLIGFDR
jgi:hypothetical protein